MGLQLTLILIQDIGRALQFSIWASATAFIHHDVGKLRAEETPETHQLKLGRELEKLRTKHKRGQNL